MTGAVVRVEVTATRGSTPREVGASMIVHADGQTGTIGGGALEWEAAAHARRMLALGKDRDRRTIPLGPATGQCCGGAVTLAFIRAESDADLPPALTPALPVDPIWVFGAGHVGRALVATLAPLPQFDVTWIDIAADRFPDTIPPHILPRIAPDPADIVTAAPPAARHLVLTHSHALDLAICDALLRRPFAFAGLIGSQTKWARFRTRLRHAGHADAQINRIACPIGDPRLGKHPQAIAVSVAHSLISHQMTNNSAGTAARDRLSQA